MVEVDDHGREGADRPRRLSDHPFEGVLHCPLVGQTSQWVGSGSQLSEREIAQVPEDGRGLGHALADPPGRAAVRFAGVADEHRADDLPADEQRLTGRDTGQLSAHLAAGQRGAVATLGVAAGEPNGQARAGGGMLEGMLGTRLSARGSGDLDRSARGHVCDQPTQPGLDGLRRGGELRSARPPARGDGEQALPSERQERVPFDGDPGDLGIFRRRVTRVKADQRRDVVSTSGIAIALSWARSRSAEDASLGVAIRKLMTSTRPRSLASPLVVSAVRKLSSNTCRFAALTSARPLSPSTAIAATATNNTNRDRKNRVLARISAKRIPPCIDLLPQPLETSRQGCVPEPA